VHPGCIAWLTESRAAPHDPQEADRRGTKNTLVLKLAVVLEGRSEPDRDDVPFAA
jgi:hypothetical protein